MARHKVLFQFRMAICKIHMLSTKEKYALTTATCFLCNFCHFVRYLPFHKTIIHFETPFYFNLPIFQLSFLTIWFHPSILTSKKSFFLLPYHFSRPSNSFPLLSQFLIDPVHDIWIINRKLKRYLLLSAISILWAAIEESGLEAFWVRIKAVCQKGDFLL